MQQIRKNSLLAAAAIGSVALMQATHGLWADAAGRTQGIGRKGTASLERRRRKIAKKSRQQQRRRAKGKD